MSESTDVDKSIISFSSQSSHSHSLLCNIIMYSIMGTHITGEDLRNHNSIINQKSIYT